VISGASPLRPGYQALMAEAREGRFDVVVAEGLDRLSREQAGVASLFKLLQFHRVAIVTRAEGEISELHVGLKGAMNALFLKDLALKTHRGLEDRVLSGGGRAYGYEAANRLDAHGEPVRGLRHVRPDEAAIVRRID
jgi:site-specific DNA recombinase